jgi:phosphoribosylanthranilate isomerase
MNVQQAIRAVGPFAVDVSGGVEAAPGIKAAAKIDDFLRQVLTTYPSKFQ